MAKNVRMGGSDKVYSAAADRRRSSPITIKDLPPSKMITIQPDMFRKLGMDESYQRIRITTWVNNLIHVLKSGGQIVAPIHVAERLDGSWWILDGQQRFWAHDECKIPLRAHLYHVTTHEQERDLFLVLNAQRRLSSDFTVKAWSGPSGAIVRAWHERDGVLQGRIGFGTGGCSITATVAIKGLLVLMIGGKQRGVGEIQAILSRLDRELLTTTGTDAMLQKAKCERFYTLLAEVFPPPMSARYMPVISLAHVAHGRWITLQSCVLPSRSSLTHLRKTNWEALAPTPAHRFLPLLISEVDRKWK